MLINLCWQLVAITKQGHSVVFADEDSHILLKSEDKLPMRHVHGTYETDICVNNPGFTGLGGR